MLSMLGKYQKDNPIQTEPVSTQLMTIYAGLAIVLVLIPEWMAELIIAFNNSSHKKQLPTSTSAWENVPELKLASMSFYELRKLAINLKIKGYSSDTKSDLAKSLLTVISRKTSKKRSTRLFFD